MFNFWKRWKKHRVSPNKVVNSYIYDYDNKISRDNRFVNARFDYTCCEDEPIY